MPELWGEDECEVKKIMDDFDFPYFPASSSGSAWCR